MVGQDLGDDLGWGGSQIQRRGREVDMSQDPLDVAQRHLRVPGHPVGRGVTQIVQGPVRPQLLVGAGEHRPRGVIRQTAATVSGWSTTTGRPPRAGAAAPRETW